MVTIATQTVSAGGPFGTSRRGEGVGSGVIVDASGVVLTNAHVVDGATSIAVTTADGRRWNAEPMALEPDLDLAVLRLEGASGLPVVPMADSDALLLGETAIAIGNPYGLGLTVSTGVVASIRRDVEVRPGLWHSYVQTDAAINPGNSGGALIDLDGRLMGINTAIRADAEGIGFAIPVNRAAKVVRDVMAYGQVRAPWLGFDVQDVSPRRLVGTPFTKGALWVAAVHPGGPAQLAGVQPGDLVVAVDGRPVASRADLENFLADRGPEGRLAVTVLRSGVTLDPVLTTTLPPPLIGRYVVDKVWRIGLRESADGLIISSVDPTGALAGLGVAAGDVLWGLDGQRIIGRATLDARVGAAKARHRPSVLLTVARGRVRGSADVPIGAAR